MESGVCGTTAQSDVCSSPIVSALTLHQTRFLPPLTLIINKVTAMDANHHHHHPHPPWSDLPLDIVRHIMSALSLHDRGRLRVVCKNWLRMQFHEIHLSTKLRTGTGNQLPWILTWESISEKNITCNLYHPFYEKGKPYVVQKKLNNGSLLGGLRFRGWVTAHASKKGWLLFSKIVTMFDTCSFLLYNPFTNDLIANRLFLPDFHLDSYSGIQLATFSTTPPNSRDCVIFVLIQHFREKGYYSIRTCRLGDESWKTKVFNKDPSFKDAVYFNGCFYCVTNRGELRVFDVACQSFTWLITDSIQDISFHNTRTHMVEWNEELLLVTIGDLCKLFMFDKDRKVWIRYENGTWKDKAIFIGKCSSYIVPGAEAIGEVANKVFYSSSTRDSYWTRKDPYLIRTMSNSLTDGSVCQYGEGLKIYNGTDCEQQKRIWIQPPHS